MFLMFGLLFYGRPAQYRFGFLMTGNEQTFFALGLSLLVGFLASGVNSRLHSILTKKIFVLLGSASLSIYLCHNLMYLFIDNSVLNMILSFGVGVGCYFILEKPLTMISKKVIP